MKRREFIRFGGAAAGSSALLPLLGRGPWPGRRRNLAGVAAGTDDPVRLSSNENPLGIPDTAREAIVRGFDRAHEYPGERIRALREALARHHELDPEGIVLGSGSTEVLQMAVQSRMRRGLRIVLPEPTFEDVNRYALPHSDDVELVRIPLREEDGAHDLAAMERAADGVPEGAVVYICNPNNPTGTVTPVDPLVEWISRAPQHFFLVDEAYVEYVEDPAYRPLDRWAPLRPNVVVTRTFSKVYGLAGLRVGYALAHPDTAEQMGRFATPTNPSHVGCLAALAALDDGDYVRRGLEVNRRSREIALQVLDDLELPAMPSETNFILHRIRGDLDLYRERMAEAGFRVGRAFPPYLDHNRVSLGLPEDMERWAETLRDFRSRGWV